LLAAAAKIEVSLEPKLVRPDLLRDLSDHALGGFAQAAWFSGIVGNDNPEKRDISPLEFSSKLNMMRMTSGARARSALFTPALTLL
jgi:hypothetical protein